MKTATEYHEQKQFGLLLLGEPLAGKTCVAFQFPDPYILDADEKLANAVRLFGKGKRFWYDSPERVPDQERWPTALKMLDAAIASPEPKTIVLDGLTQMADYLQDFLVGQPSAIKDLIIGGQKMMTQSHWYPFKVMGSRFIAKLRAACTAANKALIVTAHVRLEKDELTGALQLRPNISGQLADTLSSLFTDVWLLFNKVVDVSPQYPDGIQRIVRCAPTNRIQLGCSLALPPEFEFKPELIRGVYGA